MTPPDPLTIDAFGRRLRAGTISSADATEACLRRIEADNPRVNAFILVMAEEARARAREADRELAAGHDRGPLHGVPVSLKDLIDVRGTPTTAASRVRDGHVAAHDAPIVTYLREAGAVIIGKTNLHEFAFGTTSEESAFGAVKNPRDTGRSAGGSSGGSAASLVAGMALGSVGTDTGGSIRIPAAACGTVGLKPAYGDVPADGVVPLSRTLDHVGPLAQDVTDAWLLYQALMGRPAGRPLAPRPAAGLRLAVPRPYFFDLLDDEVRARFEEALERLVAAGVRADDAPIHHAADIAAVYLNISFGDAAAYHAKTVETMPERYTTPVRMRIEAARHVLAEDYVRALNGREILRREVDAAMANCDGLVLPTLAIPSPPLGAATVPVGGTEEPVRSVMLRLTQLFNLTGHPAISIPCGATRDGLPCAMQIVGPRQNTEALVRTALACEPHVNAALT